LINPNNELDRLRWDLNSKNYDSAYIDMILESAAQAINESIVDIVTTATAEAVIFAEDIGAEDFISDVDVFEDGYIYKIGTRSGQTDFSIDRVENLPNLLKNAETAKDGTRYKVIPITDKNEKPKIGASMFESMKAQQRIQVAKKDAMLAEGRDRTIRAKSVADSVRQSLNRSMPARAKEGRATSFRTATSKQDPSTQWVIPEIDRDMTQYLYDLNHRIDMDIQQAITMILSSYQREYS
jgi:hypothetical protein